jgi:hypothetical protein
MNSDAVTAVQQLTKSITSHPSSMAAPTKIVISLLRAQLATLEKELQRLENLESNAILKEN